MPDAHSTATVYPATATPFSCQSVGVAPLIRNKYWARTGGYVSKDRSVINDEFDGSLTKRIGLSRSEEGGTTANRSEPKASCAPHFSPRENEALRPPRRNGAENSSAVAQLRSHPPSHGGDVSMARCSPNSVQAVQQCTLRILPSGCVLGYGAPRQGRLGKLGVMAVLWVNDSDTANAVPSERWHCLRLLRLVPTAHGHPDSAP